MSSQHETQDRGKRSRRHFIQGSNSIYGMGDLGMVTISELIEFASRIAGAVDVPVMADADDGGGNPLNVYRAIQMYERADIACVMIEDLTGAKHLPGLSEGVLLPTDAMIDKIHAAVDARRDRKRDHGALRRAVGPRIPRARARAIGGLRRKCTPA